MQGIYTKQLCLDLCKTIQSAARISRNDVVWPINQSDFSKLKVQYLENERRKYRKQYHFL